MSQNSSPDPVDVYAGAKLRELRTNARMSQESLAAAAGVSFQQIQKYEKGANRISASRLFGFAKTLKVDPAAFFPPLDYEPSAPDPLMDRAQAIYEEARKRVAGRPRWEQLNDHDPYDQGMRQVAIDLARQELGWD